MSSNTNIGNTPVNQGYVQLIHTGETGGIDGTLRTLYDGDGTASDLQIASNKVKISTQLYIGSKTIAEYVQDVVGDMFDTNGSHTNITATYDDDGDGAIDLNATGAISGLTEGTGVTITGTANKTIAIGQSVGTSDSVTFGRVNLGSTDTSSFLTGDPKISATGYMMIQGIINETETGSAPAAIVFGNNSTYGNDEISLITNGQNRLFINSSGDIAISQDLTISGDLQVNGTTTTVNQTNLDVSDNIIGLNRGVASNANDSGLIIERGSTGNNVFIGWKETNDRVLFGTTLAEADDTGDLTITDADIQANRLYGDVTGNVTGNVTGDVTGSLSGGTVTSLSSPIALSEGGTGGGSAAEARTSLGVDAAGTDNSTNVTLAGSLDYITLSGQQITRNAIDLTTDVTGVLPIGNIDSSVVTLTGSQTLTNKTLASPAFTGDIDFSDASTPSLSITDSTNPTTTIIRSQDGLGQVGTTTSHNFGIFSHGSSRLTFGSTLVNINPNGDDYDVQIKNSSNVSLFRTDAANSRVGILDSTPSYTLDVNGIGRFTGGVIGDVTGNADTATALATARSITMSGEVSSGAVNFDGTAGVVIPNTTIGSGVIVDGSIASDANIATSKLASNTISGVALGSNLNALTVGTGMAFATGSDYTGATARQITLNLSAIDHDSLGNFEENEHIDWTTDQGDTNIHAGNYTDTNQLTTFVIQDGDTTNVTIDQGKYVKFQALTNGGLDIDWASSLGAGSSGDPYDLQFKIDLSNMSALVDTLESGDNLLVYNADEGTALAPVSEIQSALSIPSASGTTDGVVTLNANGTLTGESGLTYDTSTLALTGDQTISGVLKHGSNGDNRLTLDDDSDSAQVNQVTLAGVNNVNILIDGTNNGVGDFQVRARPTTANDLDTASIILDIDETTAIFDNITSQQFKIGGASRTTINESGLQVQSGSLGVGQTPPSVNGSAHISNLLRVGTSGEVALTVNDGGGNANVTFNHTSKVPDRDGNSGRIEVNVDSSGGEYMAFELAGNVTTGVSVATTEIARINSTGLQSSLSGTAASPALRVNDSDTGLYRIADNKLGISTAGTFAVAVDASQNVGIGTSTPESKLNIVDSGETIIRLYASTASTRSGIWFTNGSYSYGTNIGTDNKFHITGNINSESELVTVDSSGNVGIGTNSPNAKLEVASGNSGGDAALDSPTIRINNTTESPDWDTGDVVGTLEWYASDTSGNAPYVTSFIKSVNPQENGTLPVGYLSFGTSPYNQSGGATEEFRMEADGDFHAKQDVVAYSTTPSDKRLKTNIKDIDYGLDTIMSLNPKQYDWKEDNRHDIGFIAQEVEKVIPEIVKDKKHFDKDIKTLDYEKLTAVLIKAVQEQQEQINELKEQLNG